MYQVSRSQKPLKLTCAIVLLLANAREDLAQVLYLSLHCFHVRHGTAREEKALRGQDQTQT
jgi:hypothetical protein